MKKIIADRFLDAVKHWRTWREDIASPIIDLDERRLLAFAMGDGDAQLPLNQY